MFQSVPPSVRSLIGPKNLFIMAVFGLLLYVYLSNTKLRGFVEQYNHISSKFYNRQFVTSGNINTSLLESMDNGFNSSFGISTNGAQADKASDELIESTRSSNASAVPGSAPNDKHFTTSTTAKIDPPASSTTQSVLLSKLPEFSTKATIETKHSTPATKLQVSTTKSRTTQKIVATTAKTVQTTIKDAKLQTSVVLSPTTESTTTKTIASTTTSTTTQKIVATTARTEAKPTTIKDVLTTSVTLQIKESTTKTSQKTITNNPPTENPLDRSTTKTHEAKDNNEKCRLWKTGINWSEPAKPVVKLDPDKFLYPGLIWGPNNQIVGLWQSMYLAIRLNRTLILPKFRQHFTNAGGIEAPEERLDAQRIRDFMSTMSIDEAYQKCDGSFDVALQAMSVRSVEARQFEIETKMNVFHPKRNQTYEGATSLRLNDDEVKPPPSIPTFPGENATLTFAPWLTSDKTALLNAYSTSARCAVYVGPFFTIGVGPKNSVALPLNVSSDVINNDVIPDDVMYSAVVDAVARPPCIAEAARQYVKETFNNEPYVAVHWRYDKLDWGRNCKSKTSPACKIVGMSNPFQIATAIVNKVAKSNRGENNVTFRYAYIATPPSINDFRDEILNEIVKLNPNFINMKADVKVFLTNRYEQCWGDGRWKKVGEVVSLVEMELMRGGSWFFHSLGSTWSSNVRPLRRTISPDGKIIRKYEASVLDVVDEVQKSIKQS